MSELALRRMFDTTDELLAGTSNPRHRRILINWRRHACLEIMGRYQELLAPDMTVPHPVYRLTDHRGNTTVLDGMEAVAGFYRSLVEQGATVMWVQDDRIAVGDWGFAIASIFHRLIPGHVLAGGREPVDDEAATYLVRFGQAMFWQYTEDGLMKGEHVYTAGGRGRSITELAPESVITPARAIEILTPILAATPDR